MTQHSAYHDGLTVDRRDNAFVFAVVDDRYPIGRRRSQRPNLQLEIKTYIVLANLRCCLQDDPEVLVRNAGQRSNETLVCENFGDRRTVKDGCKRGIHDWI